MFGLDVLLDCPGLHVSDLAVTADAITVHAESTAAHSNCPQCGTHAARIHSRYTRTIKDLPIQGKRVVLLVTTRRFFCDQRHCPRTLFCEQLSELATKHARATGLLSESHQAIGLALGGEAGARLAEKLSVPTSPDTLLRRVKSAPDENLPPPRYVGVDDWAIRKGQHYGTILIDLELRRVIDILPGRDGEALKQWLRDHPSVEVITRDRWLAYAEAAREGAPQAKQVADRWHLLKNLREAVERMLARFSSQIHAVTHEEKPTEVTPQNPTTELELSTSSQAVESSQNSSTLQQPESKNISPRDQAREAKKQVRQQRHRLVKELRSQGHSIREIARQTGLSIKAVIRYQREEKCPDWNPGRKGPSQMDKHKSFVEEWISRGGRNTSELHRLLQEKGCCVLYDTVRRYVNQIVGSTGKPGRRVGEVKKASTSPPSARKLSFEFICLPKKVETEPRWLDRFRVRHDLRQFPEHTRAEHRKCPVK
jgi:transposase